MSVERFPSEGDGRVRLHYRALTDEEKLQMVTIKTKGAELLDLINSLGQGREYSLAKTKIEEAVMWAVKGITG